MILKMDDEIRNVLKATILKKLKRRGSKWGRTHTSIDNLTSGVPKHLRGLAKDVAEELIKEGLLLAKPTSYGLEVSLNPKMKAKIGRDHRKVSRSLMILTLCCSLSSSLHAHPCRRLREAQDVEWWQKSL